MNLYRLDNNDYCSYDYIDSCIVCAENEDEARMINPITSWDKNNKDGRTNWAKSPETVIVTYIGVADPNLVKGVIHTSYHS